MEQKKWWASSADSKKVSLSIKGFGVAVIPAIILIGKMFDIPVTEAELVGLVNSFAVLASAVMVFLGLLRKLYIKLVS